METAARINGSITNVCGQSERVGSYVAPVLFRNVSGKAEG
jgi:hypothetical protein